MGPGERNFLVATILVMITVTVAQRHGADNRRQNSVSKQMTFSEKTQIWNLRKDPLKAKIRD